MPNRKFLTLIVAIALAGLTALTTLQYVNSADERALRDTELVEVYLVKKDIPKGFPGDRALDEGYIAKDRIPRKYHPATALTSTTAFQAKVALAPMAAGLPVVDGDFVEPRIAHESVAQRLPKTMQAVTISVSDVQGVARLVVPGDRVTLTLTTDKTASGGMGKETKVVLQNIEVLAVGKTTELQPGEQAPAAENAATAGVAKTVDSSLMTFAAPLVDAERIINASQSGYIHLTLAPPDYTAVPVPAVNHDNLFS